METSAVASRTRRNNRRSTPRSNGGNSNRTQVKQPCTIDMPRAMEHAKATGNLSNGQRNMNATFVTAANGLSQQDFTAMFGKKIVDFDELITQNTFMVSLEDGQYHENVTEFPQRNGTVRSYVHKIRRRRRHPRR